MTKENLYQPKAIPVQNLWYRDCFRHSYTTTTFSKKKVPSGENKKRQDAYENEEDKRAERLAKRREKRRKVLEKETPEDRQHRLAKCTATSWDFAENGNKVRASFMDFSGSVNRES